MLNAKAIAGYGPSMPSAMFIPFVVACALFMENLDATVISTALPAIAADLHEDPIALKLALTSYMLSLAAFIPVSGWLADRRGARGLSRRNRRVRPRLDPLRSLLEPRRFRGGAHHSGRWRSDGSGGAARPPPQLSPVRTRDGSGLAHHSRTCRPAAGFQPQTVTSSARGAARRPVASRAHAARKRRFVEYNLRRPRTIGGIRTNLRCGQTATENHTTDWTAGFCQTGGRHCVARAGGGLGSQDQ
jgi:hypothetical protein